MMKRRASFLTIRRIISVGAFIILCLGTLLTAGSVSRAASNAPPKLDINPTCESPGRKEVALGPSIEACRSSENEAHKELIKTWSHYPKADKTDCVAQISQGGLPSYIELHTCLLALKHARAIRQAHDGGHSKKTTSAKRHLSQ
jgi:hypothetical protein